MTWGAFLLGESQAEAMFPLLISRDNEDVCSKSIRKIFDVYFEKKKKNHPTYRPIGEMEGRMRETNIFLRVGCYMYLQKRSADKM